MFGVACLVTTLWVFVDVLNVSEANQGRIRKMSCAAAVFMWLAFLIAGYWYVFSYKVDKAIILKGPGRSPTIFSWRPRSIWSSCC